MTVEGFPASESSGGLCKQYAGSPHLIHDQCQTFSEKIVMRRVAVSKLTGSGGRCVGGNADGPFYLSEMMRPLKYIRIRI